MTLSRYMGKYDRNAAVLDARIEVAVLTAARDVAPLFKVNNWTWALIETPGVPTEAQIAESFRRLVQGLYRNRCTRVGSGRLQVSREYDGDDAALKLFLDLAEVWEGD